MPATAVIPAPIAYTKVVAVKKLVVGFLVYSQSTWPAFSFLEEVCAGLCSGHPAGKHSCPSLARVCDPVLLL